MIRWNDVLTYAKRGNLPPPRRVERSDAAWRASLPDDAYSVARGKGTERPFSSDMCSLFEPGRHACVCCDTQLFDATTKFE